MSMHAERDIVMSDQSVCQSHWHCIETNAHIKLFPPSSSGMTSLLSATAVKLHIGVGKIAIFDRNGCYLRNSQR